MQHASCSKTVGILQECWRHSQCHSWYQCVDGSVHRLNFMLALPQVAGSASGISAFQMDIKVEGITLDIMKKVCHI